MEQLTALKYKLPSLRRQSNAFLLPAHCGFTVNTSPLSVGDNTLHYSLCSGKKMLRSLLEANLSFMNLKHY